MTNSWRTSRSTLLCPPAPGCIAFAPVSRSAVWLLAAAAASKKTLNLLAKDFMLSTSPGGFAITVPSDTEKYAEFLRSHPWRQGGVSDRRRQAHWPRNRLAAGRRRSEDRCPLPRFGRRCVPHGRGVPRLRRN